MNEKFKENSNNLTEKNTAQHMKNVEFFKNWELIV